MAQSYQYSRPCRTCGGQHAHIIGSQSADCLLLTISTYNVNRRSGNIDSHPPLELQTYQVPVDVRGQADLFDNIWFDFAELKDINRASRERLSFSTRDKGVLKAQAPLPWLKWTRYDGVQGQTRKQENYDTLWQNFTRVDLDSGVLPIACVTIGKSDLAVRAHKSRLSTDAAGENYFTPSESSQLPNLVGAPMPSSPSNSHTRDVTGDCNFEDIWFEKGQINMKKRPGYALPTPPDSPTLSSSSMEV